MKKYLSVILGLVALICCTDGSPGDVSTRLYEPQILAMLEDLRLRMCYADPEGLPQLEPFIYPGQLDFEIDSELGQLKGYLRNVRVEGISKFIVPELTMTITLKFNFKIKVPTLRITGEYALQGSVGGMFDVNGKNTFSLEIGDIVIGADARLQYIEGMYLKDLKLGLSLAKLNADIKGLTGDEEVNKFMNDALSELVPEIVEELPEEFLNGIETQIEDLASGYLKDLTVAELLKILSGGEPLFPPIDEEKACKI